MRRIGLWRNRLQCLIGAVLLCLTATASAAPARILTVCADPNNLPFSNQSEQGFENRLSRLLAQELGATLHYVWWAQRRGFVRNTLNADKCDIWPGVASGVDTLATSVPYYRSDYVFVTRAERPLQGLTLDDKRLPSLSIGVQMVGNDATNTPPAHAIARRGMTQNVRGYTLYGDYTRPDPPAAIIDAVERGDVDVALVWGPVAGYFAQRSPHALRLEPVTPALDGGVWPMQFDIAVGVRKGNPELLLRINQILEKDRRAIRKLMNEYHVPLV